MSALPSLTGFEYKGMAHLIGVTVVTCLKHYKASLLTWAALGHQTLAGLEVIKL